MEAEAEAPALVAEPLAAGEDADADAGLYKVVRISGQNTTCNDVLASMRSRLR